MVGVLHSYARGLAGAASSMWQTARGQRNEDHEYGITADGYDDDNDTVQGDAANVNDPSSVCVFSAFHVDALRPFMTISLLVSARSREEGARIVHGVSSLRFMDDSEADKPDALSLHDINHKGSTSMKDVLSTSDTDKDEPRVKGTAKSPSPLLVALRVARWSGPKCTHRGGCSSGATWPWSWALWLDARSWCWSCSGS